MSSDRTRKFLLDVSATTPVNSAAFEGAYSDSFSDRVYDELCKRARAVLASGRPVVLDASFRTHRHRECARTLAEELGIEFMLIECRAATELCRERLELRQREPSVSDGRVEILETFVESFEPIDELPAGMHQVVDTSLPVDHNLQLLSRTLPTWPDGLSV